jgi:hypothetical protein
LAPENLAYTLTVAAVVAFAGYQLLSKPKLTSKR